MLSSPDMQSFVCPGVGILPLSPRAIVGCGMRQAAAEDPRGYAAYVRRQGGPVGGCFSGAGAFGTTPAAGATPIPPPDPSNRALGVDKGELEFWGLLAVFVGGGGYLGYRYVPSHRIFGTLGGAAAGLTLLFFGGLGWYIASGAKNW